MNEKNEDLKELKRRLKRSSHFKQLADLIAAIILTEARADYNFMKKTISGFKGLLGDLVEAAWNSSKGTIETTLPKPFKNIRHIRHITSVPKLNNDQSRDNQLAWSIEGTVNSPKPRDDRQVVSEFSYIKGAVSFAKSIRDINRPRAASPGPSCYYFDKLHQKQRAPRVIFPRSTGDRHSHIPISISPGPSKYYSSIHPIAKHS